MGGRGGGGHITSTPFEVAPGNTLTFVPSRGTGGTQVSFTFTLSVAGSEPSDVQTVTISIEDNHSPTVGNAGRAIHFGLGADHGHWGYAPKFEWPVQDYQASPSSDSTSTTITGGGAITLECWGYQTRADSSTPNLGALFHLGGSSSTSCPQEQSSEASSSNCPAGEVRLNNLRAERQVGFDYGDPAVQGTVASDAYPHYGRWVHWAVATCGGDPGCTEPHRIYQDGEVVTEVEVVERGYNWEALEGLHLGAMGQTWHVGIIDEFRVWESYRTRHQIHEHMYTSLVGGAAAHPGLAAYYSFNEPGEETAVTANDDSGNGNTLTFGGCPHTAAHPSRNSPYDVCSHKPEALVVDGMFEPGRPPREVCSAPVGGHMDPLDIDAVGSHEEEGGSEMLFNLPAQDPDGDGISLYVTALPDRGTLWRGNQMTLVKLGHPLSTNTKLLFVPDPLGGGAPYAKFTYEARDEDRTSLPLEVVVNVRCWPGSEVDLESSTCVDCPVGSYNPRRGGTCVKCPDFSTTLGSGGTGCICGVSGFEWDPDTETCLGVDGATCFRTGCGSFASCGADGSCSCDGGYEMVPGVYPEMENKDEFNCRVSYASSGEQRLFWSISACTNGLSFLAVLLTVGQFMYNKATRNDVVRSYLAVLLPDVIMALVYYPFHIGNVLRGDEMDEGSCKFVAFLTYGIVIATFSGPIVVSYISYKKIRLLVVSQKFQKHPVSRRTMTFVLIAPWLLGFTTATAVWSQDLLGSYRGLICYATRMDKFLTGGLTFLFLLVSCILTITFYVKIHLLVRKNKMKGVKQESGVLKRGFKLVGALFFTWFLFVYAGILGYLQLPVSVTVELLGAVLISLQPLVDSYMILSMRAVWEEALKYHSMKVSRKPGATSEGSESNTTGTRVASI